MDTVSSSTFLANDKHKLMIATGVFEGCDITISLEYKNGYLLWSQARGKTEITQFAYKRFQTLFFAKRYFNKLVDRYDLTITKGLNSNG